nr:formin-like protein 6 [Penaeus vannamei]
MRKGIGPETPMIMETKEKQDTEEEEEDEDGCRDDGDDGGATWGQGVSVPQHHRCPARERVNSPPQPPINRQDYQDHPLGLLPSSSSSSSSPSAPHAGRILHCTSAVGHYAALHDVLCTRSLLHNEEPVAVPPLPPLLGEPSGTPPAPHGVPWQPAGSATPVPQQLFFIRASTPDDERGLASAEALPTRECELKTLKTTPGSSSPRPLAPRPCGTRGLPRAPIAKWLAHEQPPLLNLDNECPGACTPIPPPPPSTPQRAIANSPPGPSSRNRRNSMLVAPKLDPNGEAAADREFGRSVRKPSRSNKTQETHVGIADGELRNPHVKFTTICADRQGYAGASRSGSRPGRVRGSLQRARGARAFKTLVPPAGVNTSASKDNSS